MQPEELIGLWDSAPYDFGATESTRLALLADGGGWTAVTGRSADAGVGGAARPAPRVRRLTWDCPRPELLEIRYDDYEFVRTQYTLLPDTLHLSQHLDSAHQFALTCREVTRQDGGGAPDEQTLSVHAPREAANGTSWGAAHALPAVERSSPWPDGVRRVPRPDGENP